MMSMLAPNGSRTDVGLTRESTLDRTASLQPTDTYDLFTYKSLFSPRNDLNLTAVRQCTFYLWPQWVDPSIRTADMVRTGFYYTGDGDIVRCFSCTIQVSDWRPGMEPMEVHRRKSPTCEFLKTLMVTTPRYSLNAREDSSQNTNSSAAVSRSLDERRDHIIPVDVNVRNISGRTMQGNQLNSDVLRSSTNVSHENISVVDRESGGGNVPDANTQDMAENSIAQGSRENILGSNTESTSENNISDVNRGMGGVNLPVVSTGSVSESLLQESQLNSSYLERSSTEAASENAAGAPSLIDEVNIIDELNRMRILEDERSRSNETSNTDETQRVNSSFNAEEEGVNSPLNAVSSTGTERVISRSSNDDDDDDNNDDDDEEDDDEDDVEVDGGDSGSDSDDDDDDDDDDDEDDENDDDDDDDDDDVVESHGEEASGAIASSQRKGSFKDKSKLREENDRLRSTIMCRKCKNERVQTLFLPCRHLVSCESCSESMDACIFCNETILGTVRTFLT